MPQGPQLILLLFRDGVGRDLLDVLRIVREHLIRRRVLQILGSVLFEQKAVGAAAADLLGFGLNLGGCQVVAVFIF